METEVLSPPQPTMRAPPMETYPFSTNAYQAPATPSPPSSSDTSFPVLAISILGILTTAILLVSYYVFVIKCCLNWRRSDVLGRLASSRSRRRRWREEDLFTVYAAAAESRGLQEAAIRAIPTFRFRKAADGGDSDQKAGLLHECAVCLNEFEDGEGLRRLPGCGHAFHIDCVDTWLQNSANCPLCRADVAAAGSIPPDQPFAHGAHHHEEPTHRSGSIVIDVRDDGGDAEEAIAQQLPQQQQAAAPASQPRLPSPRPAQKKGRRRLHHLSSMGDECIDVRRAGKDEQFEGVQPIRRSFSMDSSCDRQLYLSVQEILQQNPHFCYSGEIRSGEGSSSGGVHSAARVRRSFFSFGRSSRSSAVLPVLVEP